MTNVYSSSVYYVQFCYFRAEFLGDVLRAARQTQTFLSFIVFVTLRRKAIFTLKYFEIDNHFKKHHFFQVDIRENSLETSQELRMLSRSLSLSTSVYQCLLVSTSVV